MEFAERLLQIYNHGALSLMIGIGHRTGLFDALRGHPAATSAEIAAAAGLQERYVREWLGAMVTGGIVEVTSGEPRYTLPEPHAAHLTRAAGPDNMAGLGQYIAEMGRVEEHVVACFRTGGGVPYDKYPRFHEIMAEDSATFVAAALEPHILPLIPGLTGRLRAGLRVLDVGCGRGLTLARLAELFPASRFEGVDFSPDAIAFAQANAAAKGLPNVVYAVRDAAAPLEPEAYDWITTFDAIHDQARPLAVLENIRQALKPDGVYLMQEIRGSSHHHSDIGHPLAPLLYTISCMHCMTVSLAYGGEGLGAMWGEEKTREYLRRAGFGAVEKHELDHDPQNFWYVIRKPA